MCSSCKEDAERAEERDKTLHYSPEEKWKTDYQIKGDLFETDSLRPDVIEKIKSAMIELNLPEDTQEKMLKYEPTQGMIRSRYLWDKTNKNIPWAWGYRRRLKQKRDKQDHDAALDEVAQRITDKLNEFYPGWQQEATFRSYCPKCHLQTVEYAYVDWDKITRFRQEGNMWGTPVYPGVFTCPYCGYQWTD